jgi:hypothetical protein
MVVPGVTLLKLREISMPRLNTSQRRILGLPASYLSTIAFRHIPTTPQSRGVMTKMREVSDTPPILKMS